VRRVGETLSEMNALAAKGLFEDFLLPNLAAVLSIMPQKKEAVSCLLCAFSYTKSDYRLKLLVSLRELLNN